MSEKQEVRQPTKPIASGAPSADDQVKELKALLERQEKTHASQLDELRQQVASIAAQSQGGISADTLARTMTEMQKANRDEAKRRKAEKLERVYQVQRDRDAWLATGPNEYTGSMSGAPGMDVTIMANSPEEADGKYRSYWGINSIGAKRKLTITAVEKKEEVAA